MDRRQFLIAHGSGRRACCVPGGSRRPARRGARRRATPPSGSTPRAAIDGWDEPEPGRFVPAAKLIEAIGSAGSTWSAMTVGEVGNGPDRYRKAPSRTVAEWDALIAEQSRHFAKIESAADIRAARAAGKIGLIYNFQDTTALEGDAARVATFAALGVKQIQLTYNKRNLAGDGCLERANAGLSDFGREVIAEIEEAQGPARPQPCRPADDRRGHRGEPSGPSPSPTAPAATSSTCRATRSTPRCGRWPTRAGSFGLYLMPFLRPRGQPQREDLIRHIEHALKVCGEDHIGLGTDGPLFGYEINEETREEASPNSTRTGSSAASRRRAKRPTCSIWSRAITTPAATPASPPTSQARGWSSARIDKLLGGNFVRLFGEAWGAEPKSLTQVCSFFVLDM